MFYKTPFFSKKCSLLLIYRNHFGISYTIFIKSEKMRKKLLGGIVMLPEADILRKAVREIGAFSAFFPFTIDTLKFFWYYIKVTLGKK